MTYRTRPARIAPMSPTLCVFAGRLNRFLADLHQERGDIYAAGGTLARDGSEDEKRANRAEEDRVRSEQESAARLLATIEDAPGPRGACLNRAHTGGAPECNATARFVQWWERARPAEMAGDLWHGGQLPAFGSETSPIATVDPGDGQPIVVLDSESAEFIAVPKDSKEPEGPTVWRRITKVLDVCEVKDAGRMVILSVPVPKGIVLRLGALEWTVRRTERFLTMPPKLTGGVILDPQAGPEVGDELTICGFAGDGTS